MKTFLNYLPDIISLLKQCNEINKIPRDSIDVRRNQSKKPYTIIHEEDSLKTARAFIYHPNKIDYTILRFEDSVRAYNGKNNVDTIIKVASGELNSTIQ